MDTLCVDAATIRSATAVADARETTRAFLEALRQPAVDSEDPEPAYGKSVWAALTRPDKARVARPRPLANGGPAAGSLPVTPDLPQPQSLHGPMGL